ncbi:MAG: adenylate/guanylate cyclase domain-containing protein [Burkholderiales bacterium]|nr:adenylate/guanylate cyclase domain-containing protein [Burkholderiales bacterium]
MITATPHATTHAMASRQTQAMTVLFADICGSTRLYCALGDQAARAIVTAGIELIVAVLPQFGGRSIKTLGDEVMCVFRDPSEAASAAIEMQARTAAARPGGKQLALHIGLHHGPVLVEDGDVFGDTVNAASYLCAIATAGQILTTEPTRARLSATVQLCTRPLFFAVIKGSAAESTIYQVVWQSDTATLTDVNLRRHNLVPPDDGALIVACAGQEARLDPRSPTLVLGRDAGCDIRVADAFASRRHALLTLRRTQIYLTDQSTNGTFVRRESGELAHVFRSELLLDGAGEISLGRAFDQTLLRPISFRRDRRALYRV